MDETQIEENKETLLTPEFLGKLEQLHLVSKKVFLGRMKGERRSRRRGTSVEFADYRDYARGDDLRFLDWNIYGRLDRLFVKLFYEEEDLHVYIVLDGSLSMEYGDPKKYLHARRFAAALAYIALASLDRVGIGVFSADRFDWLQPVRGAGQINKILRFLEDAEPGGATDLETGALQFRVRQSRPGIILFISDFLDPSGFEESLRVFSQGKNEVYAIQVLAPEEVDPDLAGALRLLDLETEEPVEVSVSAELIRNYRRRLTAYQEAIRDFCKRRRIHFLMTRSDDDFFDLVNISLRRLGLVE